MATRKRTVSVALPAAVLVLAACSWGVQEPGLLTTPTPRSPSPDAGRGEPLPAGTDLGLGRELAGEQAVVLLDAAGRRAYRPLADVSPEQFRRCLCTPLFAVTPRLRFGVTTLLQLTFARSTRRRGGWTSCCRTSPSCPA